MEQNNKNNYLNLFTILICGVPAIGKTFLCEKIKKLFNDGNLIYLNFDQYSDINKDNYFQFQQMRNDYLNNYNINLNNILNNNINNNNITKDLFILLDDNFYLKSMRKKIFNSFMDKYYNINDNDINFYYIEIFLKTNNIDYLIENNNLRNNIIPNEIIIKMNNIFEYDSPYLKNDHIIMYDINNKDSLNNISFQNILKNKQKFKINLNNNKNITNNLNEKNNKAKIIDLIENNLRKKISEIMKIKTNKISGKTISNKKKEFMKLIYDSINKQKLIKDKNINTLISKLNFNNINNNELIINNIIDFFLNNFIKD